MGDQTEETNYLRLHLILHKKVNEVLRRLFATEWNLQNPNSHWEDSSTNRSSFIGGSGKSLYNKSQRIQKEYLSTRNLTDWDLPLLVDSIQCLNVNVPPKSLEDLKKVRNELAHCGEPKLATDKYEDYWGRVKISLSQLNLSSKEIKDIENIPAIDSNAANITKSAKDKELEAVVLKFKEKGNEVFKQKKYEDAIDLYTQAISLPGVPKDDLALLYSNRSISFLKMGDIPSAKEDAKGCIHLTPTWWKGYYRLAMAYKSNEKYQLAIKNFVLCRKFHPNPGQDITDEINLCKMLIGKLSREEHMDPMYFQRTYEEISEMLPGSTPESLQAGDNFAIRMGTTTSICTQGHNYYFGRGVKQCFREAARFYARAAAKGNAEGMYNLAMMTKEGKGVKCNFFEAIQLLEQAASQQPLAQLDPKCKIIFPNLGVKEAEHSLGLTFEEGTGVIRDFERARYWYIRAIKNFSGASANNVAFMYSEGKGVKRCLKTAIDYWKLGSAMGTVRCMENLVYEFFNMRDFVSMQLWYLYAIEKGSVELKISPKICFENFFDPEVSNEYDKDTFTTNLWKEVESGPLGHLIDPEIKKANEYMLNPGKLKQDVTPKTIPIFPIDVSTPDGYKKSIILAHRYGFNQIIKGRTSTQFTGGKGNLQPKPVIDLFGLKQIYMKEMKEKNQDHVYEGFVLKLTVIEDALVKGGTAAINLIGEDEHKTCQRIFVYKYDLNKNDLQENLGFGSKISIVNPYYRITKDGNPAIRVDDPNTMFIHSQLKNSKQCRYCGSENGQDGQKPVHCRTCKRCYYCSKKCLLLDSSELQHDLVCKKRI